MCVDAVAACVCGCGCEYSSVGCCCGCGDCGGCSFGGLSSRGRACVAARVCVACHGGVYVCAAGECVVRLWRWGVGDWCAAGRDLYVVRGDVLVTVEGWWDAGDCAVGVAGVVVAVDAPCHGYDRRCWIVRVCNGDTCG